MDHLTAKLLAYSSDTISQGNLSKVQELFPENLVSRKDLQKTAARPVLPALLYFCSFSPAESELRAILSAACPRRRPHGEAPGKVILQPVGLSFL